MTTEQGVTVIQYWWAPKRNMGRNKGCAATSKGTTSDEDSTSASSCRGALGSKFYLGVVPNLRQVCWAFTTSARPSLVRAILEDMPTPWMLAGTMVLVALGQSSRESHRGQPLRPSMLKEGDGHAERDRGIWGDPLGYRQPRLHILLHYSS